jgi:23S rRNA (uracil1939-C5)-methyltransferase
MIGDRTEGDSAGGALPEPLDPPPAGRSPADAVDCAHAAECGGCPLIQIGYEEQLAAKRARVATAAGRYASLEQVSTREVRPAEPIVGYRGRAKLIVSPEGKIGLYGRTGDHQVVDIPGCRVLAPVLAAVAAALRTLVAAPPPAVRTLLLPYQETAGGVLRAVDLREVRARRGAGGSLESAVLVTLVLQRDRAPSRDELCAAGRALRQLLPGVLGIAANLHDVDSPQILGQETLVLDGATNAEDTIGTTYHLASYGSFVQAHREQAAQVHALLAREVAALDLGERSGRPPRVLDLYGGSGAISLALAKANADVTMVESFVPAAQAARLAAEAQGLSLDVRTGDAGLVALALHRADTRFDVLVANPPRRGLSPSAREAIARLAPPLVLYVSCDPETLARDLDHLTRLGYSTDELAPLDMIPLTEEVETVTALRRAPAPPPRVLFEDEDIVVVEKGPHEPVEPHAEYAGSLLGRTAQLPGAPQLFAVHPLDPGTSGLCILARSQEARSAWASALAGAGRLIFVVATKGVTPSKGAITRDLRDAGHLYPARTRYRRLAVASGHSVLRVIPDGGRPHQIRRHLAAIGHPVLGDERYGHAPTNRYFEEKHGLDRAFVHLVRIEVTHPKSGLRLLVESPLGGDLRATLERAGGTQVLRFLEHKHALGDDHTASLSAVSPDELESPPSSRAYDGPPSLRQFEGPPSSRVLEERPSQRGDMARGPGSEAPPSSRRRPPHDGPPSTRRASCPVVVEQRRVPLVPRTQDTPGASAPRPVLPTPPAGVLIEPADLDEAPRTVRAEIVTPDDD